MEIRVEKGDLITAKGDLLVVNEFSGVVKPDGGTGAVDNALGGLIVKYAKEEKFTGQDGQMLVFRTQGKIPAKWVLVIGLGDRKRFDLERVRWTAAQSLKKAKDLRAKRVVSILHGAGVGKLSARESAQAMTEGILLANYTFTKFKKDEEKKEGERALKEFVIVEKDAGKARQAQAGVVEGSLAAAGTIYARDLVNEPSIHATPTMLKTRAEEIAKTSKGKIKIKSYDPAALARMGAGGILGVSLGSDHPPYLVHLSYKPREAKKSIAFVGKAITFDSGGLSLQPADVMKTMKCDMAGAAAVLGLFSVLTAWNPKIEVHGIFAACENMPSGKAIKPGDVVKTMSGKTIEIMNTDAEGRVTLADSLVYANKQKVDAIVDLATLTGACMVALGPDIAGLMTNDQKLADRVLLAGKNTGERLWQLPLPPEYREMIISKVADLKNLGGKFGGALTAGLFLYEFAEQTPWVHLDIAGPAYVEKESAPYITYGGTGFGVRIMLNLIKNF